MKLSGHQLSILINSKNNWLIWNLSFGFFGYRCLPYEEAVTEKWKSIPPLANLIPGSGQTGMDRSYIFYNSGASRGEAPRRFLFQYVLEPRGLFFHISAEEKRFIFVWGRSADGCSLLGATYKQYGVRMLGGLGLKHLCKRCGWDFGNKHVRSSTGSKATVVDMCKCCLLGKEGSVRWGF